MLNFKYIFDYSRIKLYIPQIFNKAYILNYVPGCYMMSTIYTQKSTTYLEAMCSSVRNSYCLDWDSPPKCHVTKGNVYSLSLVRGRVW